MKSIQSVIKFIIVGVTTFTVTSWVEKKYILKSVDVNVPDHNLKNKNLFRRITESSPSAFKIALVAVLLTSAHDYFGLSLLSLVEEATPNLIKESLNKKHAQQYLEQLYLKRHLLFQLHSAHAGSLSIADQKALKALVAQIDVERERLGNLIAGDASERIKLTITIVFLVVFLFGNSNIPMYNFLIRAIRRLLRKGRLSKSALRRLVLYLFERGYKIPPDLLDILYSE